MKQKEIHFHLATTLTPEQYVAGLTNFGPTQPKPATVPSPSQQGTIHTQEPVAEGPRSPQVGTATKYQQFSEDTLAVARFDKVPLDPKYHGYFRLPGTQTLLRVFRSIRTRNYRLYFSGQMVSVLGSWLHSVAQSWLVYRLTGSPLQLGLVAFVSQAPLLFLSPIGGIIADRYPRRWVVMGTQISSMLLAFALGAIALWGHIRLWQILALASLQGMVSAIDVPARQALVSQIVGPDDLVNAVSLNSSIFSHASSVAPVVAGFLVARIGEGWCFAINGVSYLAVIAGLFMMRLDERMTGRTLRSALSSVREGFHFVRDTAPIRRILALLGIVSLLGLPFTVLMPIFADKILHTGPKGLGLLMGANGVGSFVGSLLLASRRGLSGLGRWVAFGSAGFGIALILFSFSHFFSLSAVILPLARFCMFYVITAGNTLVQAMSPDALRGRVISVLAMLILGVAPFGALLAGFLAQRFGAPWTAAVGGLASLAGALVCSVNLPALTVQGRQLILANLGSKMTFGSRTSGQRNVSIDSKG